MGGEKYIPIMTTNRSDVSVELGIKEVEGMLHNK